MIVALLPLILAAVGCKVNEHIQDALTYQWGEVMAPRFIEYVEADETLDEAQKTELLAKAATVTATITEPDVRGWNVNRKYLAAVYETYMPVYEVYVGYVSADATLRPRSKKIRMRSAMRIVNSIVLLMK